MCYLHKMSGWQIQKHKLIAGSLMSRSHVSGHALVCIWHSSQFAKPATMVIASNGSPLALTATHIYLIFMPFLGSNFLGHAKTAFIKTGQLIMPLESFGELTRWYNQIANLPIAFLLERSLRKHMVSCIFTGLGGNMPNKWPVMTNLFASQEKTPTQRQMQSLGARLASPEAECPDDGRTWQVWSPTLKAHKISETYKLGVTWIFKSCRYIVHMEPLRILKESFGPISNNGDLLSNFPRVNQINNTYSY